MFTSQVSQLDGILRDLTPDRFADVFKNLLGQCQADLTHRGRISLEIDPNASRPAPFNVIANEVTPYYTGLNVANYTGFVDAADAPDILIRRGWAGVFIGPVNIRANLFDNRRIGLVVHNGIWADDLWIENILDHNGDPYDFDHTYKKAGVTIGTRAAGNFIEGTNVSLTLTDDAGNDEVDVTIAAKHSYRKAGVSVATRSYLNLIEGAGITLTATDDAANDEVELTIAVNQTHFYCRAQENWSEDDTVSVKRLDAYGGTESGSAFDAVFRIKLTAGTRDHDPNVVAGDDILCMLDPDDGVTVVVIDPDAYSDLVGTVKGYLFAPRAGSKQIEGTGSGWGLGDGTGNAVSRGGSGINWTTYFMYAKANDDTDVDATEDRIAAQNHNHAINLPLTMDALPDHQHPVGFHCGIVNYATADPADYVGYLITQLYDDHTDSADPFYTGIQKTAVSGSHAYTEHLDLTLTPSGSAIGNTEGSNSDPAKFRLYWKERLNNSVEGLS